MLHYLVWCFVKKLIKQQEKMGKRVQKMYFFAHFLCPDLGKEVERMTEQQAKKILEMRSHGFGYRSIGAMVGLSRDIVRNFCKSRGLTGYGPVLCQNVQKEIQRGKACLYCGGGLEQPPTGRHRKFCSDSCRREWWKAHPEEVKRREAAFYHMTCSNCGKEFVSYGNRKRKYCCHGCYVEARGRC